MKQILSIFSLLFCIATAPAQDGFFTLAKAPLAITRDAQTLDFSFTNNGDQPLHRIKLTSGVKTRVKSVVIIETIGPHKTVVFDISKALAPGSDYRQATVTCAKYSVPIRLEQ